MAPLDTSVPCTADTGRCSMSHLAVLIVLLAAIAQSSPPAFAGLTSTETVTVAATVNTKVNINTADVNELMKLSGVGRSLAEKIVQYRDTHGPFKKATDLRKVEGVGNSLWEKNRARIVVK
jgi:competence protein ComEA